MEKESGSELLKESVMNGHDTDFKVSGIAMQYFAICKRELWFYLRGIDIDKQNKYIARGEHIDENTYQNLEKNTEIIDGMIAPDFLDENTIIEVKPSSKMTDGSEMQLKYYLYYLRKFKNISVDGILAIPDERKRIEIPFTEDIKQEIENAIDEIYTIWKSESPPELEKKPFCDSCAYQDICWL